MIIYMIYLIHYISIHHIILLYTIYSILYTSTITLYHILCTIYYSERPGRARRNHNEGGTCSPFECVAPGSGAAGADAHAPLRY